MENQYYFTKKFEEIPIKVIAQSVILLNDFLLEDEKEEIKEAYNEDGAIEWAVPHHSTWGMEVRNFLRTNDLTDDMLPDKNWDDYYIQVVEYALGLRVL